MTTIDYSDYSRAELNEAYRAIDASVYPENYQALVREIEKRKQAGSDPTDQLGVDKESAANVKIAVRFVGGIQCVAALVMVGMIFAGVIAGIPAIIVGLALASLNAAAGVGALMHKPFGLWLTVFNQALQVPQIIAGGLLYTYSGLGGIYAGVSWGEHFRFGFNSNFSPGFQFFLLQHAPEVSTVSVDLIAIGFIALIARALHINDSSQK